MSADEARARTVGGRIGLVVAALFIPVAFALRIPTTDPLGTLYIVPVPTLVAGWIGGQRVGPWAARATTQRNWIALVLRLALLAILVGAPIVAVELAILGAASDVTTGDVPVALAIPKMVLSAALLTALGTTFLGPFVAMATIPAAVIWAFLVRRRLGGAASRR